MTTANISKTDAMDDGFWIQKKEKFEISKKISRKSRHEIVWKESFVVQFSAHFLNEFECLS